ncbi:MAG: GntR family transcriptional regulator [Pseudomonadota bacterium]|jgi:GntR family transcriptional regulator
MFMLQPQSGVPLYRQLVEQIRRLIAGGQLAPGTELPSVRELAQQHAVNPMTISKAYALLEAEGWLERNRGKPMTVAARAQGALPMDERLGQLTPQVKALVLAARQLELDRDAVFGLIERNWESSDDP